MSWTLILILLVLGLPLVGAILALLLGRFLPKRGGTLLAALPLFLSSVALLLLTQLLPLGADLGQPIPPTLSTQAALRYAPTSRWEQPPRTLNATIAFSPTPTPTPTVAITPTSTPHPFSLATVVVRNGTGESGLATRTTRELQTEGFRVIEPEDDPEEGNRPHTLILDRGDHAEVRQALVGYLNVAPEYVEINSDEPSGADIIVILGDDYGNPATVTPTPTLVSEPRATPTPHPLSAASISVRNGTRRPGLAGRTAERLEAEGFQVVEVETDERGNRPHTLILDRGDHSTIREALAEFLDVDPEYIEINADIEAEADIVVILGDDFVE